MMTRQEIRELASFQTDQTMGALVLSLYFQPEPPENRSHHSEAIQAKDLVKHDLKEANGAR